MNWRVRAGPATAFPGVQEVIPRRWGSRIPSRLRPPAADALPIWASPSTNSFDGRLISGVWIVDTLRSISVSGWHRYRRDPHPLPTRDRDSCRLLTPAEYSTAFGAPRRHTPLKSPAAAGDVGGHPSPRHPNSTRIKLTIRDS